MTAYTDKPLVVTVPAAKRAPLEAEEEQLTMSYRLRKSWMLSLGVIGVFMMMACVYYIIPTVPEFSQYRLLRSYASSGTTTNAAKRQTRTILLWNDFFGNKRWYLPYDIMGPEYFRDELQCNVYQCELTYERDFLPSTEMFDAVLFHAAQPFPLRNSVPSRRRSEQFYVFALMEPPGETKHVLNDENYFYNLTMTYRLDSDIVWPYKSVEEIDFQRVVAPAKYPIWRKVPTEEWNDTNNIWDLWQTKTKNVTWFVSHCNTLSEREKLVKSLQNYIDVDIYGKCGTLSCPHHTKECDDLLDQKYKFYLSFENSLCIDYVTEKLYNALEHNIIPVVFGGADYTRFLPPHSYINVEDFENVEKLASHLTYVSTHPEVYVRYFWWRTHYRVVKRSPYCDLCEKLHSTTERQKTQTYRNIQEWWLRDSCRFQSKIKF